MHSEYDFRALPLNRMNRESVRTSRQLREKFICSERWNVLILWNLNGYNRTDNADNLVLNLVCFIPNRFL